MGKNESIAGMKIQENKQQNGKGKKKMTGWYIFIGILLVGGIFAARGWANLTKEHKEAMNVSLEGVDFGKLKDGTYTGSYEGGMYHWRTNEVQVTVAGGKVSDIRLLSSKASYKEDFKTKLYGSVIKEQTLLVDGVSGATLDSKACLKAVEAALKKAR